MFCHKCGSPLPDRAKFCPKCGEMVSNCMTDAKGMDHHKMSVWGMITVCTATAAVIGVIIVIMVSFTKTRREDNSFFATDHFTDIDMDSASNNNGAVSDIGESADPDSDDNSDVSDMGESGQGQSAQDRTKALEVYADEVQKIISQDSTFLFDLIDIDGNDIPELVADCPGYSVSLFTWADGKIITLMGDWAYGAMGNSGYRYIPGRNIIHNCNMDQGGAVILETYLAVNKYNTLANLSGELRICYFDDTNRNGMADEGEKFCDEPYYYFGDAEITKEEYESYRSEGDYEWISGEKTAEEMLTILNSGNIE